MQLEKPIENTTSTQIPLTEAKVRLVLKYTFLSCNYHTVNQILFTVKVRDSYSLVITGILRSYQVFLTKVRVT